MYDPDPAIPLPPDEADRLRALDSYRVLDTPPEDAFDRIVRLAGGIAGTPIALISLVDADRQWFKARFGIDAAETPRELAFCAHAICEEEMMVVPDARDDLRFRHNPLVTGEPHIRFYAGAQLRAPSGHALGTLCVIDRRPRELSIEQAAMLRDLAALVVDTLELRRLAGRDPLTGVHARRRFLDLAGEELRRAAAAAALLVIEVSRFGALADEHGREAGDMVLRLLGRFLNRVARPTDIVGRLDDHTFGVLLPETPRADAEALAAELRAGIGRLIVRPPGRAFTFAVRYAVAAPAPGEAALAPALARAEAALYGRDA